MDGNLRMPWEDIGESLWKHYLSMFMICWCRHIKALCMGCCTVVSVIHQPSSEVFELFDQLCLLASGEMLTFGPAGHAARSFSSVGLPVPLHANPADHFLHCINADFEVCHASSCLCKAAHVCASLCKPVQSEHSKPDCTAREEQTTCSCNAADLHTPHALLTLNSYLLRPIP